ncbi:MAG: glycosyltransferase family 39 protein [Planctomycetes bacterium]|nr:glycosyltransferase family 39 protein [Planctomycetota bacterium]
MTRPDAGAATYERWERWALLGVLFLGAATRTCQLDWGLPYELHPDEPGYLRCALRLAEEGGTDTHLFSRSHMITSLNRLAIGLVDWTTDPPGNLPRDRLTLWFLSSPRPFYLAARGMTVALALVTLLVLHRFGRRMGGPVAGLVAAGLVAVHPLHVEQSRLVVPDVHLLLAMSCALSLAHRYLTGGRTSSLLWSFAWVGVAAGAKYNGASVTLAPALALLLEFPRIGGRRAIALGTAGCALAATGFALANPYAVLHPKLAYIGFSYQMRLAAEAHFWAAPVSALREYATVLGPDLGLVGALGAVFAVVRPGSGSRAQHLPTIAFGAAFFCYMASRPLHYPRYILPVVPVLALFCGLLVARVAARSKHAHVKCATTLLLLAVLAVRGVAEYVASTTVRGREDTRVRASVWARSALPMGAGVATEPRAVQIPSRSAFEAAGMDPSCREAALAEWGGRAYDVTVPWNLGERTLAEYRAMGVRYLFLADWTWDRIRSREGYARQLANLAETLEAARPTVTFEPRDEAGRATDGPVIRVYELPAQ